MKDLIYPEFVKCISDQLSVYPLDMSDHLSPHFILNEVFSSDTADRYKISNIPKDLPSVLLNAVYLAHYALEPLRAIVGPLIVNSWYRCVTLNQLVRGAKQSRHLYGRAADVYSPSVSPSALFNYCCNKGIDAIEYPTFIHIQI